MTRTRKRRVQSQDPDLDRKLYKIKKVALKNTHENISAIIHHLQAAAEVQNQGHAAIHPHPVVHRRVHHLEVPAVEVQLHLDLNHAHDHHLFQEDADHQAS